MNHSINQFINRLDTKVDAVRRTTKTFLNACHLTAFAYVRIYQDGRVGWVTTNSDHDRLLVESGFLGQDPLFDTANALKEGHHLWFHDRQFPGSEAFYRDRAQRFHLDHGLVVVSHQKDYLETGCFSGLLSKRPLYNAFTRQSGLFKAYLEFFKQQLPRSMLSLLEDGAHLQDFKPKYGRDSPTDHRAIVAACGWGHLLKISKRERACLALLREGLTYQSIGVRLKISPRTVESYLQSVKNKLTLETRSDLCQIAHQLFQLGLS